MSRWQDALQGSSRCFICDQWFSEGGTWWWLLGLEDREVICGKCESSLESIGPIGCEVCGRPKFDRIGKGDGGTCTDCQKWVLEPPWDKFPFGHRALYVYNPFLQEVLARFKFRGDAALGGVFSTKLLKLAKKYGSYDLVTTIPLKEKRHWERGFNQAEELAKCFSTVTLLKRVSESEEKQSKRGRNERMEALKGAFQLDLNRGGIDIRGKHVLIVDDIYTTGATLRSAASAIYAGGAKGVFAITVARSVGSLEFRKGRSGVEN